ncbi:antibiotic biosynthesis monooxygenase family protein [Marinomonas ostreistagni]|uniref:Antibiotic biosynthesis monooxygenase n=1 Tax=Marinomonas ostreistagni TaxID=359209 RepID=A0ABS0ZAX8_9GAMM|nr:antibiotic biosynthesis monooxygenase [Marinomonas ostreistagni]MBJ7550563.1 antibiotic biosynthesis monooxygenase [Marinomonas ostreistagni]
MIRVVYEWHVSPEHLSEFCDAWQQTTGLVREMYAGAHGSVLLQHESKLNHLLTIARWNTVEDWRSFWSSDNPPEILRMSKLATLVSVNVYEELGNFISK